MPNGIQFGRDSGRIRNASTTFRRDASGNPVLDENQPIAVGLEVGTGRTLALVGGGLNFSGGSLTVAGGRIELGSVGANSQVQLTPLDPAQPELGWRLGYANVSQFEDIQFSGAIVDASSLNVVNGLGGGGIQLQGRRINLSNGSFVLSDTKGNQPGEDITLRADRLHLQDESGISTSAYTTEALRSGNVQIQTQRLLLEGGSQISIFAGGTGGRAGTLSIIPLDSRVPSSIEANGGVDNGGWSPSGLLNQIEDDASGGRIAVTTGQLILQGGAQIQSTAFGSNDAGSVRIEAQAIAIEGTGIVNGQVAVDETGFPFGSGLFADTQMNSSWERRALNGDYRSVNDSQRRLCANFH